MVFPLDLFVNDSVALKPKRPTLKLPLSVKLITELSCGNKQVLKKFPGALTAVNHQGCRGCCNRNENYDMYMYMYIHTNLNRKKKFQYFIHATFQSLLSTVCWKRIFARVTIRVTQLFTFQRRI